MAVFAFHYNGKMKKAFKKNRERIADINSQIEDSLSGIRVVKSFANEKEEMKLNFEKEKEEMKVKFEEQLKNEEERVKEEESETKALLARLVEQQSATVKSMNELKEVFRQLQQEKK